MPAQAPNFIAGDDVPPSVFVKQSGDNAVVKAGLNEVAIGVSHEGTRTAPITGVTPLAAIADEPVMVYTDGFSCEIKANDTIVAGDVLAPDANGLAKVAGAGMTFSAVAKTAAAAGERVKAIIRRGINGGDGVLSAVQQALTGAGAVNITSFLTALTFNAVGHALTLADGSFVGQRKKITAVAITNSGTGILTPTTLDDGDTITFSVVGDTVVLRWSGSAWKVIERYNVATGATTTPVLA